MDAEAEVFLDSKVGGGVAGWRVRLVLQLETDASKRIMGIIIFVTIEDARGARCGRVTMHGVRGLLERLQTELGGRRVDEVEVHREREVLEKVNQPSD